MPDTFVTAKPKIKIALVNNDFAVGGIQRLIVDLLERSQDERFEFCLITLMQFENRGDFYDLVPEGVPVYKLNFKGFFDIKEWVRLAKLLYNLRPRIVHTNLFFANTVFALLKPLFGYKLITAYRNTEADKPSLHKLIDRLLSIFSWKIVADSNGVADFVSREEGINRGKFEVIYNGVDLRNVHTSKNQFASSRDAVRKELRVGPEDKLFLNIARLTSQKGHDLMLESMNVLVNVFGVKNVKLALIGDGSLMSELREKTAHYHLEERVIFLGERTDIEKFYIASDFFLLTSVREGFCITAMTGLAFGLPLISTRVAGVSEYLKDGINGFFVERIPQDVARKMKRAAEADGLSLHRMKLAAEESAQAYSLERYAQRYDALLSRCFES